MEQIKPFLYQRVLIFEHDQIFCFPLHDSLDAAIYYAKADLSSSNPPLSVEIHSFKHEGYRIIDKGEEDV